MRVRKEKISTKRIRQRIYFFLALLSIIIPLSAPLYGVFADDESDVKDSYSSYAGDSKNTVDVLDKLSNEGSFSREDSFRYIFSRVVEPNYINDVTNYAEGSMPDDADTSIIKGGFACDSTEPMNLIAANCDIPNLSAQLGQNVMRTLGTNGITGGDRQSAKAIMGWGVPDGIPTGQVPTDESARVNKYTGLEVFGYSLGYTNYNGEWDDVIPSTKARLLSNFGLMDKINLTGTSIWEGTKAGLSSLVDGLSWDPTTWLGNVTSSFEAGSSRGLLVIIDTSDANIVATRAWVRSGNSVGGAFYNVKVLTDKEVMEAATALVAKAFTAEMENEVNGDPELSEVLDLQSPPVFTFDPNKETEESKTARQKAEDENKKIDEENKRTEEENKTSDKKKEIKPHVAVPDKKIVSEEDQFSEFKENDPKVKQGEGKGITCSTESSYEGYKSCWNVKWEELKKSSFSGKGPIVSKIQKNVVNNLIQKLPHSDPSKAISHYVCADPNGNAKLNADGSYQYVYTGFNANGVAQVNQACSPIRPTIKGGYFGTGDASVDSLTDTRHISKVSSRGAFSFIPVIGDLGNAIQGFASFLTKLVAQLTNELLNLSFSPLMEKLGITTIVKTSVNSFKNTIFFPLVSMVAMIAAFMMIFSALMTRNLTQFFTSLATLLLTFFLGVIILNSPDKVIDAVDRVPAKVDQYMLGLLLNTKDADGMCTTSPDTSSYGVRSAQCNVWKSLVYQPWVYSQWGVSDNKLNAAGTKTTGEAFKNTNEDLVGNASVNLGGGTTLNNWAAYQLKLTTSGTLTTTDTAHPAGQTDNNLYRIVDAQAGPNNAEGRETRYFKAWSGAGTHRLLNSILALILSIFMLLTLGSLLVIKVEISFIVSVMLIGLPFIFLFGLTPKGKGKLLAYLGALISLSLKRAISAFMISLLLLLINVVTPSNSDSYSIVFLASMLVLGFFKLYKKELFDLFKFSPSNPLSGQGLLSGDHSELRERFINNIPLSIRNSFNLNKGRIKGQISGATGGALGGVAAAFQLERRDDDGKLIKRSPSALLSDVKDAAKFGVKDGRTQGGQRDFNRSYNKMLRKNMDAFAVANQAVDKVQEEGNRRIKSGVDVAAKGLSDVVNKDRKYKNEIGDDKLITDKNQRTLRKQAKEIEKLYSNRKLTEAQRDEIAKKVEDKLDKVAEDMDKVNLKEANRFRKKHRKPLIDNDIKVGTSVDEIKNNAKGTIDKFTEGKYEKKTPDEKE